MIHRKLIKIIKINICSHHYHITTGLNSCNPIKTSGHNSCNSKILQDAISYLKLDSFAALSSSCPKMKVQKRSNVSFDILRLKIILFTTIICELSEKKF